MWFPNDIWGVIKQYCGFEKYYRIPARKKNIIYNDYVAKLNDICFDHIKEIILTTPPTSLSVCLVKVFIHLSKYNDWIQTARELSRVWDRFSVILATRCQNCLTTLFCLNNNDGHRCDDCNNCFTHNILTRVSEQFYTVFVKGTTMTT